MNNRTQTILNALKNQALLKYLTPIAEKPFIFSITSSQKQQRPFQLYQYEQQQQIYTNYNTLQHKIHNQILYKFNEYLFQDEYAQLQMQLFCLQQSIQIRQNEISFMRLQIQNEKINRNMNHSNMQQKYKKQEKDRLKRVNEEEVMKRLMMIREEKYEQNKQDAISRLKIYSSLNCQIQPDQSIVKNAKISNYMNTVQNNPLSLNFNQLKKSHRQNNAIYSRRSQAYSSDHQQKNRAMITRHRQKDKGDTATDTKQGFRQIDLKTIQNQIQFYERAWKDAKKLNKKQKVRQFKKKIFQKLQEFWALKQQ